MVVCMGFIILYMADRSSGGVGINRNIFLKMCFLLRKTYNHQTSLKWTGLSVCGHEAGSYTSAMPLVVSLLRCRMYTRPHIM